MKASEILKQVLTMCETEKQGIAISGPVESERAFVWRWFGEDANIITGMGSAFKEAKWFYSYIEELKGIADLIIEVDGCRVYIYEVEE